MTTHVEPKGQMKGSRDIPRIDDLVSEFAVICYVKEETRGKSSCTFSNVARFVFPGEVTHRTQELGNAG